jgi:hypothetical protein
LNTQERKTRKLETRLSFSRPKTERLHADDVDVPTATLIRKSELEPYWLCPSQHLLIKNWKTISYDASRATTVL